MIKILVLLLTFVSNGLLYGYEIMDVSCLRNDEIGGYLGDINSRMWTPEPPLKYNGKIITWEDYKNEKDHINWAHEGTHSVCSRIREKNPTDKGESAQNGYYLLNGIGIILEPTPPSFKLKEVARAIPKNRRGSNYQLYMVSQAKYWNDTPLYPMEELIAYVHGTLVGLEYSSRTNTLYSYKCAVEIYYYAEMSYNLCKKYEYKDTKKYKELLDMMQKRLVMIKKELDK